MSASRSRHSLIRKKKKNTPTATTARAVTTQREARMQRKPRRADTPIPGCPASVAKLNHVRPQNRKRKANGQRAGQPASSVRNLCAAKLSKLRNGLPGAEDFLRGTANGSTRRFDEGLPCASGTKSNRRGYTRDGGEAFDINFCISASQ